MSDLNQSNLHYHAITMEHNLQQPHLLLLQWIPNLNRMYKLAAREYISVYCYAIIKIDSNANVNPKIKFDLNLTWFVSCGFKLRSLDNPVMRALILATMILSI